LKTNDHKSSEECLAKRETKKADVAEHPEVFDHVGLLVNEPSSYAGVLFIKSSDKLAQTARLSLA
jgi:hypothetical protein